jgi:hypothetical protein
MKGIKKTNGFNNQHDQPVDNRQYLAKEFGELSEKLPSYLRHSGMMIYTLIPESNPPKYAWYYLDSPLDASKDDLMNAEFVRIGDNSISDELITFSGNTESMLSALETFSGVTESKVSTLETFSGNTESKLSTLETFSGVTESKLSALETFSGVTESKLSALETFSGNTENRLNHLESLTGNTSTLTIYEDEFILENDIINEFIISNMDGNNILDVFINGLKIKKTDYIFYTESKVVLLYDELEINDSIIIKYT